jgi:hypothetical protein
LSITRAGCDYWHRPELPVPAGYGDSAAGAVADRTKPRKVDRFVGVIRAWLAADPRLRATVIHERLVADYEFAGTTSGSRSTEPRPGAGSRSRPTGRPTTGAAPPVRGRRRRAGPGRLDDEGSILLAGGGIEAKVYSFHMTLPYSRDPFVCFTTSQDRATFFDCHVAHSRTSARCRVDRPS